MNEEDEEHEEAEDLEEGALTAVERSAATSEGAGGSGTGGEVDEGRRYWKAAIAHLAPARREAAWEFYLDRLESSAAADTLGGVMLLLEAHLAFFDALPATLGAAARQIERALEPVSGGAAPANLGPSSANSTAPAGEGLPPPARRRLSVGWIAAGSALLGGLLAGAGILCGQSQSVFSPPFSAIRPPAPRDARLARTHLLAVEPWQDAATHRPKGCVLIISRTARAEATKDGGTKVYLLSPAEDVRQDWESLRQLAR